MVGARAFFFLLCDMVFVIIVSLRVVLSFREGGGIEVSRFVCMLVSEGTAVGRDTRSRGVVCTRFLVHRTPCVVATRLSAGRCQKEVFL